MKRDKHDLGNGWMPTNAKVEKPETAIGMKPMTREEYTLVKETEEEFRRRGHFKRIFPTLEYSYYKQFFLNNERPANRVLDERIMTKRRLKALPIGNAK